MHQLLSTNELLSVSQIQMLMKLIRVLTPGHANQNAVSALLGSLLQALKSGRTYKQPDCPMSRALTA